EIERRPNEIGRDPAVRHVADETRLARIAADHFGPLVPCGGPAIAHKIRKQRMCALAPAETDEGAHDANLVRRVIVPCLATVAAVGELAPIALEGWRYERSRNAAEVSGRRERDGRRRRIEVAELRCAREKIDAMDRRRRDERSRKIMPELVAIGSPARGFTGIAERFSDADCRVVALRAQKSSQYECIGFSEYPSWLIDAGSSPSVAAL